MKNLLLGFLVLIQFIATSQTVFSTLSEALIIAEKNNYSTQLSEEQKSLARLTKQSSYGNAFNPKVPVSASITDNTKLPVSFLPGEAFGMPAGSFRQLTMGQRFISSYNFAPQFEILNFGNLAKIKSAKVNEQLVSNSTLVNKKALFDQVNACYHNILSFQSQVLILKQNLSKADSLLKIVRLKFEQGIVRKQDVNETEINFIIIKDKIEQAEVSLENQYLTLKLLCETEEKLVVSELLSTTKFDSALTIEGDLLEQNAKLQYDFSVAECNAAKWAHAPTLSFITTFNWQNNSNKSFIDKNNPWINNNFWSLRLSWDLITNVNKLSMLKTSMINTKMAEINYHHAKLQTKIQNEQLKNDYTKSIVQYKNAVSIYELKLDTYKKSSLQYAANILPLDKLLIAQTDLLTAELNKVSNLATISFNKSKIEISNQIK